MTTGAHKKTSHFTGRNVLLVVWLPQDLMYKAHEPLVKGGERKLYNLGQEVGLNFSNSVCAFGNGLSYLFARGNEAIFSLYICQQDEEMCSNYCNCVGFQGTNHGHPSMHNMSGEPLSFVVWPCASCGGYIANHSQAKCGNGHCSGAARPSKHQKRYLSRQQELLRLVEDGTHTVYSCKPCAACISRVTRPLRCAECIAVDVSE